MTTISQMVKNRLPDEAELFASSLASFVEEAGALAGFEGIPEDSLSVLQKSLVADMAAKALILPAMSKRSEERRVGKEGLRLGRDRWAPLY